MRPPPDVQRICGEVTPNAVGGYLVCSRPPDHDRHANTDGVLWSINLEPVLVDLLQAGIVASSIGEGVQQLIGQRDMIASHVLALLIGRASRDGQDPAVVDWLTRQAPAVIEELLQQLRRDPVSTLRAAPAGPTTAEGTA